MLLHHIFTNYVCMNSEMFTATIYCKLMITYPTILWVHHFFRALVLAFLPYFIRYHVHVFCLFPDTSDRFYETLYERRTTSVCSAYSFLSYLGSATVAAILLR